MNPTSPLGRYVVQSTGTKRSVRQHQSPFTPLPNIHLPKLPKLILIQMDAFPGMDLSIPYPFRGLDLGVDRLVRTPISTQNQPLEFLENH